MHDCQKFREDWIAGCGAGEDTGCDECRLFCEDASAILTALRSMNPVPDVEAPYWSWFGTRLRARLLDEAGVALTPGTDFDGVDGASWVRLSFASAPDVVGEAVDRIVAWQRTL